MANEPFNNWVTTILGGAGALTGAEEFPIVQGGVTVSATPANLQAYLLAANSPFPGYRGGGTRFYPAQARIAAGVATISHTLNTIHYTPFFVFRDVTADRYYLQTGSTNAVAGQANVGLYGPSATLGTPGALVATLQTAVAIPGTINTPVIFAPIGASVAMAAGFYWLAVQLDATINMTGLGGGAAQALQFGTTNSAAGLFAASSQTSGYTEAAAYAGGLPAIATPVQSSGNLTTGGFRAQ